MLNIKKMGFILVTVLYSNTIYAKQPITGVESAVCAAVMYFAVGESKNQEDKSLYQTVGHAYLLNGQALLGESQFEKAYSVAKKSVNGYPDKDFKSAIQICLLKLAK